MLPPFLGRLAMSSGRDRRDVRDRWVRRWADALLALFAIHVDVRGPGVVGGGRGRLVVANHRSTIDVALLLRTFGGRMVSRADLSGWPLVGPAARSVGTIFVDRSSAVSGANTIRQIRNALIAGETVCVFPEGTTYEGDVVRPFRPGAFVAALRTGASVVPVGLAYETGSGAAFVGEGFMQHLGRMAAADPSRVCARVGDPIEVESGARARDLEKRIHNAVQALVHEARAIVDR
jgi:1-acyl-sn-glycerol-3-phosphate acyltransferase